MPPKSRSNRRGTTTPADEPKSSTDEQSAIRTPQGSQRWPTRITILLSPHVTQLRRLMTLARLTTKEHRWYNAYSYALNFTSQRTSTDVSLLSVWPQASFEWTAQSDRVPDLYDTSQQGSDEALSNVHLTVQEEANAPPSPQTATDQDTPYLARLRPRTGKGVYAIDLFT